jgi:ribulose-phosphate 3-epimerase
LGAKIKIAPSILAADFTRLGEQIAEAEVAGADMIHIDVMDGRFVPNITMGVLVVEAAHRATQLPLDVHLMMVEPDHLLEDFAKAGAATIHVHWETGYHIHRTLSAIKELGCQVGIAINPHTPALVLTEILTIVDVVLVMSVNPGFGGQVLIPETLAKIRQLHALIESQERQIDIMVDGGINAQTVASVVEAGGSSLVVGSALFSSEHSVKTGMNRLHAALTAVTVAD